MRDASPSFNGWLTFVYFLRTPESKTSYQQNYYSALLDILARQYQFTVLAMSSDTPAIAALILVPIAIVASAAYVLLKLSQVYKGLVRACSRFWKNKLSSTGNSRRGNKLRCSNLTSSQSYADSWLDLESNAGDETHRDTFINQSPIRANNNHRNENSFGIDTSIWHPNRSARLAWSFANPRSRSPNPFESSSVARPLPVVQRPERLSLEDVDSLFVLTKVEVVHQ